MESAALEAAGSNTRGGGWAPSGPASGSECPPGTARRALRRRTRRATALRRQHVDRAAAPRPRREAPSISWASAAQARRSTHSARAGIEVPRTSRGCARPRLAVAALAPGLQPARRARPLCLQLRGVRVARRDAFARGQFAEGLKRAGIATKMAFASVYTCFLISSLWHSLSAAAGYKALAVGLWKHLGCGRCRFHARVHHAARLGWQVTRVQEAIRH